MATFNVFTIASKTGATGTVNYAHGLSEAPKALLFYFTFLTVGTDNYDAPSSLGIGAWGTNGVQWCGATRSDFSGSANICRRLFSTTAAISGPDGTSGIDFKANVQSVDSTNITLNWTNIPATSGFPIIVVAIGGTDVDAYCNYATTPTSPGTVNYTGLAANGKAAIFIGVGGVTTAETNTTNCGLAIGLVSATAEDSRSMFGVDGATTQAYYSSLNNALISVNSVGALSYAASFSSWNSGTFTLNWTQEAAAAYYFGYLLLGGTGLLTFSDNDILAGTEVYTTTGMGPRVILVSGNGTTTVESGATGNMGFAIGAGMQISGNEWCASFGKPSGGDGHGIVSTSRIYTVDLGGNQVADNGATLTASSGTTESFTIVETETGGASTLMYLVLGTVPFNTFNFAATEPLDVDGTAALVRTQDFTDAVNALAMDGAVVLQGGSTTFARTEPLDIDGMTTLVGGLLQFEGAEDLSIDGAVDMIGGLSIMLPDYLPKLRVVTLVRFHDD